MPVRKIPKNYLSVTGSFASQKNGQMGSFESLLEKEYMLLLDFDDSVESFEEQPVTIPVPGVTKGYTPDFLVHYYADPTAGEIRKPLLTEVKPEIAPPVKRSATYSGSVQGGVQSITTPACSPGGSMATCHGISCAPS